MKIIFMGTPDFAAESLKAIYEAGHEILSVVTNPDRPKGRGMKLIATPVKQYAQEKEIKIYQPQKVKGNTEFIEEIKNYAKRGAEYLAKLGFDERFCKICEGVNRYSDTRPREPESDILELVDQFGGMLLDRPERAGFRPEDALIQLERANLKDVNNIYLDKFHEFVNMMLEVEV